MSDTPASQPASADGSSATRVLAPAEIDCSCRLPLLVLFLSGAVWLVIGSVFALISSIKFHSPNFLAEAAWLTYGRVRPAYLNSLLYGFCLQAGLGVALWLLARLGRTTLAQRWLVTMGAVFWNLGVTVGVLGILSGDSTGFEYLEMPGYAALLALIGYLLIGIGGVITFHQRRERQLFVSQWFLFAALFWFPWIYSTANLLLLTFPVRGVAQAVIAWWYAGNLSVVWFGLAGIGTVFYFVPKLTNRELHSQYLALFAFWMLILFASWGGVPNSAPVPAWMPAISTVATVLTIIAVLAVALNVYQTTGRFVLIAKTSPSLSFVLCGVAALILASVMNISGVLFDNAQELHFTWFETARTQLQFYGFFTMVMFGAVYHILPQLTGTEFHFPKLVGVHFWVATLGIILIVVPLAIGGLVQAIQFQDATIPFINIAQTTLHFLRVSTLGDSLLWAGHLIFAGNLIGLVARFYRVRAAAAYATVTEDLFKAAEAKA
jgi:cytochrome c oxidase cbb3-type subunit 1